MRLAQVHDRLVDPVARADDHREIEVRVGVLRIELGGAAKLADRLVDLSGRVHHVPEIEAHAVVVRLQALRLRARAGAPRRDGPGIEARSPGCCAPRRRPASGAAPPRAARSASGHATGLQILGGQEVVRQRRRAGLVPTCISAPAMSARSDRSA